MYNITEYTKNKAKGLNVHVKASTNKKKKIDVFKGDKKVASIGAIDYLDFPNYVIKKGKEYANERRRLYNLRHKNDHGLNGFYAKNLLW